MTQTQLQYWSFMLGGMVDLPLPLSYVDLLALPVVEIDCAVLHAGRSLNGPHMHQARWSGASAAALLNEVTIQHGAYYAHLYAANGYATSVELSALERAVLAYRMDGEVLTHEHGYPVRLIVPGLYGYKMPRQIHRILLSDEPLPGSWEKRGWSLDGRVRIMSAILEPRHQAQLSDTITINGVAFAGERTVAQVEVSISDGPWMPVPFTQASPNTFARWSIDWTPPVSGNHSIRVRAADRAGSVQSDAHRIIVRT